MPNKHEELWEVLDALTELGLAYIFGLQKLSQNQKASCLKTSRLERSGPSKKLASDEFYQPAGHNVQAKQCTADFSACAGTIMPNKHEELWAVLDALNPGCLGDYKAFAEFYSKPIRKGQSSTATEYEVQKVCFRPYIITIFTMCSSTLPCVLCVTICLLLLLLLLLQGAERLARLQRALQRVYLRRTKAIIQDQLPKKRDNIVFCQLKPLQYRCRFDHSTVTSLSQFALPYMTITKDMAYKEMNDRSTKGGAAAVLAWLALGFQGIQGISGHEHAGQCNRPALLSSPGRVFILMHGSFLTCCQEF
jgi:hypothetical protein